LCYTHAQIASAGSAPCEYGFEWGAITGLSNGNRAHFHVQARNSEGTIVFGSDKSFSTAPAGPGGWLTPTGFLPGFP
jgi:hypothetical protein